MVRPYYWVLALLFLGYSCKVKTIHTLHFGAFIGLLLVLMGLVIRVQISGANVASLLLWWQVIASLIIGCVIITLSRSSLFTKALISIITIFILLAVKSPAECYFMAM